MWDTRVRRQKRVSRRGDRRVRRLTRVSGVLRSHQRGRGVELIRKRRSNLTRIHLDNVRLQWAEDRQELILLAARDLELLQRCDEVLDQGIDLTCGGRQPPTSL